jgi:hypothetical protein
MTASKRLLSSKGFGALTPYRLVVALVLSLFFATNEVYFTHDSFHYMQLSLFPVAGDSHPVLFGFFLRLLNDIGNVLGAPLFGLNSLSLIQSALAAALILYLLKKVKDAPVANARDFLSKFFAVIVLFLMAISMYILKAAVWTETIFIFFTVCLFYRVRSSLLTSPTCSTSRYFIDTLVILVGCAALCHVRYQAVVMALSYSIVTAITLMKKNVVDRLSKAGALTICLAVFIVVLKMPDIFLSGKKNAESLMFTGAKTSYLCFWRCSSELMSHSPECQQSSAEIRTYSCSDIALGAAPLPVHPSTFSFSDIVEKDGLTKIITWALFSPAQYLADQHTIWGLEIGRFRYQDDDAASFYPEAGVYFKNQFNRAESYKSKLFMGVEKLVHQLHFKYKVFNIGAAIFLGIVLIQLIRNFPGGYSSFLCINFIGTLLLLSTFNPHTPWRFLVQLNLLGLLAMLSGHTSEQEKIPQSNG